MEKILIKLLVGCLQIKQVCSSTVEYQTPALDMVSQLIVAETSSKPLKLGPMVPNPLLAHLSVTIKMIVNLSELQTYT